MRPGHRVCVVERHATVAQGATYGQGGAWAGWGLACGSAKVIADLVSGETPDVPCLMKRFWR